MAAADDSSIYMQSLPARNSFNKSEGGILHGGGRVYIPGRLGNQKEN
jgi:hypothetical protein